MTRRPSDRELDQLLTGLPRAAASPGFSRRVLGEIGAPPPRRRRGWPLAAAAVATASIVAIGLWLLPRPEPRPPRADARALEQEHRKLMQDLESLKASLRATEPAPVLYLGGTENVDLVLDLRPIWRADPPTAVRPAGLAAGGRPAAATAHGGDRR